ncbi:serine/threonine protein phosphatase 2A 55 kDa regulatory subunit B prime delta [Actinidia rufa]|uniref:Serine/threonine protein phosphatase 2A 55 kDa regulatory subunit B prime delta n=1 Tax=Actinidia rufa TaxID=165716 RepID=A0A7J0DG76_9ERIC|nr:serine/threonine protein phosphatase 2A 55 kDa regulatory subunit B prime delta [Actinidia rufa]
MAEDCLSNPKNEEILYLITYCTFTDPSKSPSQQDLKRLKLIQLLSLIKTSKHPLHAQILSPLFSMLSFVQKEPALGGVVVRGVLKYWPVTNCQKEVLLVGELEELVENIDPEQYKKLALPLCTQITKCLNSWNSQVAERALYVWNNEQFVKMALQATEDVFPVIVEGMEKNLKWHWSKSIKQLTENVKAMLEEMEPGLYTQCLMRLEFHESAALQEEKKREEKWERIELAAAKNQFLQQPNCIYVSSF